MFVILPTGSGKSLCYWLLAVILNRRRGRSGSILVVVSPLRALMKDQVDALAKKGATAVS